MGRVGSLKCSFSGRREAEVAKLVAGPRVYICDACVEVARRIIEQADAHLERPETSTRGGRGWWRRWVRWPRLGRREGLRLRATAFGKGFMAGQSVVARAILLVALGLSVRAAGPLRPQGQAPAAQIPRAVMETVKARFPRAVIETWTREQERGVVIYDIEFRQDGRKLEADIRQDGSLVNWEEAVAASELPAEVTKAVETKYPRSTIKEAMRITAVTNGKETVEGYEVVVETAEKKTVEVTVAPDGRILEESEVSRARVPSPPEERVGCGGARQGDEV